ncbi:hypothetical protein [Paenibacillus radicis (ex Xue et al. 2023)]|uniref:Uncharacterized protein n=1 Tax=Paenibacillus radicis (ex Xue et al. 2023) TaxID=2972489 RepID=A0ABT1YMQ3_9BACL|nr:hypothetical protein [Paenibacillus radicis (ex Xue et al. 2023)]MCR8634443.1 hypothetical protein [Paenibacillus radicis (ex Xue et al. 2023)]
MNPGYLSLLFLVVSLILFASGWMDYFMRGITSKVILLFFVSWLVTMEIVITLPHVRIGLWTIVLAVLIVAVLWRSHGLMYKLHVLSVGILLGSVSFFLQETIHLFPSMVLGSVELSMALLIGFLISSLIKVPAVQLAAVSLGLLLGEAYFRFLHKGQIEFQLGTTMLQDRWWLTVYVMRGMSLLLAGMLLMSKKSVNWIVAGVRKMVRYRD